MSSTSASQFVDFHITVCGVTELSSHSAVGVTHVLSILEPGLPGPDAFGAFGEHVRLNLRFYDIIDEITGKRGPEAEDIAALLSFGRGFMRESNAHLLAHCKMGASRSTAAMALILAQARPDRPARDALAEVARLRPLMWPNLRMIELGDAALGLKGALVAATIAFYRHVIEQRPEVGTFIIEAGRAREVRAAQALKL